MKQLKSREDFFDKSESEKYAATISRRVTVDDMKDPFYQAASFENIVDVLFDIKDEIRELKNTIHKNDEDHKKEVESLGKEHEQKEKEYIKQIKELNNKINILIQ